MKTELTEATICGIGLDVGGTKIAGGLVTPEGKIISRRVIPTLPQRGGEAVLQEAFALAVSLRDDALAVGLSVRAVGIGVGELVDLQGNVASAQTIPWRDVPVQKRFADLAPAVVEADSRAAAVSDPKAASYELGPDDEITIRALHADEITDKPFRVDPDRRCEVHPASL